jgi:hypothetical protein
MEPGLFIVLAFGALFVLLGRWLYRHPNRLYPGWGILNPENPGVKKVARAYATFFIFFGMLACSATIASRLLPGPFVVILGLAVAVSGTWLLRPRLPQPDLGVTGPVVAGPAAAAEKQPLLNKHWKRTLVITAGFAALLLIVVFALLGDSEVSKLAFATAQSNPTVRQQLGEPLKRGFFTSGNIEISGQSGHADLEIPIRGPKGRATVYAVAQKNAGLWKFDTLQVAFYGKPERVDLLKGAVDSDQPPTQ